MTDEEVNRIIAEYMHFYDICNIEDDYENRQEVVNTYYCYFTESLDTLVPVWKKLDVDYLHTSTVSNLGWEVNLHKRVQGLTYIDETEWSETIQKAAARATARAIKELDAI